MRILAIETSCDETAISIIEGNELPNNQPNPNTPMGDGLSFKILSNVVSTQIELHAEWGGVVPNIAKREHEINLIPVLRQALEKAGLLVKNSNLEIRSSKQYQNPKFEKINNNKKIQTWFEKNPALLENILEFLPTVEVPEIDAIAVTVGPGLEPALWTGINLARTLSVAWDKPIVAMNHMEGHIFSSFLENINVKCKSQNEKLSNSLSANNINFPAIALLVSGGHTEIVLMRNWFDYEIIGETRDDAVGEAFDKVAKMLDLGYPGGPIVAAKASQFLISNYSNSPNEIPNDNNQTNPKLGNKNSSKFQVPSFKITLPRPMINTDDFDFSFSGLKTAVLYLIKDLKKTLGSATSKLPEKIIENICAEFQQACIDVLISKTLKAAQKYDAKTIILGGGVSANKELKKQLEEAVRENFPGSRFYVPSSMFSSDNAAMIALPALLRILSNPSGGDEFVQDLGKIEADGNLSLGKKVFNSNLSRNS